LNEDFAFVGWALEEIKRLNDCIENMILRERVDHLSDPVLEIKRLQRCINDLVSVLALPAAWRGLELAEILAAFADSLMGMLTLDFFYARVMLKADERPIEVLRAGASHRTDEIAQSLDDWLNEDQIDQPSPTRRTIGDQEISIFPIRVGVEDDLGFIAAGSQRLGFPEQTERLVLSVAANQTAAALQHALLLSEQKRVADKVDRLVAERTRELAEANKELQLQAALLQHLPVSAWTLKPDGTPDFVNRVWLEFSGQTLDFIRSHAEAWMTAVHPDDRETASRAFWDGVHSGQCFAIETRSLRAHDGTYRWHLQQAVPLRDADGKILKFVGTTTDIDDQKRAEVELRASETNLRQIVDSIPGLVCTMDATGEIQQLNRPLLEYFGKAPEELKGWKMTDAVHPDDLPEVAKAYTYSVKTGAPYDIEHRCRRSDGVYRWFQVRALAVRDTDNNICGWYVLLTDIEDRKLAENAQRVNERNLIQIINTIPTTAWSTRPDGYCDFLSDRWLNYAGFTFEQAVGWNWTAAIHPDDAEGLSEYWQSCLASGTPVDTEARIRRFDGQYRWFLFRADPMRGESGAITKWYGTNTDIDDRKRAEEALRIRELNLLQITETIPEMLWSASPDGSIDYCNGRLRNYTGFSSKQVMSDGWINLLHPDDVEPAVEVWKSCVKSGSPYRVEVRTFHAADNTYRWCVTSALPLLDQAGRMVKWHGTVVDMHDWRQAQEELRNTQAELARMTRIMTIAQLTASIAHEVSQPLSGIITNASTCLRMLKSDPPNIDGARETAQRTIRDGNRTSEVITRLRTLFSKKPIDVEPLDLNETAREVIALLSGEFQRNSVILKYEFGDRLPAVNGDRVQLQQVILNLLRNGSDAMVAVNDRPRQLLIKTETDGNHVTVSVQDSGVGFRPEISERLFESFFTTKQEGMGIGLSVSRSIVEAHRGRLWAVRNAGPGATFAFSIPKDARNLSDQARS
jgi:PAS domain S-box-containing protein